MPPAGKKAPRGHIAFRPESKEAIDQALRASADLGHDWVGTEHLLLGLIRAEESRAAQVLRSLGFTSDELHETVRTEVTNRIAARGQ
ncbi:MAG TPA: Clp protease N-terminal domain-containing protein, partial [Streptosporangiaceae bacterium]